MAERGFVTLAFDPSFTGESGGAPRYMASPDINTEDFQAAVDYLSCGTRWTRTGSALSASAAGAGWRSTRPRSTPASRPRWPRTMYDMARIAAKGYFDEADSPDARTPQRRALADQRSRDYAYGTYARGGGVVDPLPEDAPFFVKDYYDYYKTPRGYHPRSLNSNEGWNVIGTLSFLNQPILAYAGEIQNAVLLLHGDKAHSCYMGKDAFALLRGENKELVLVPARAHRPVRRRRQERHSLGYD